MPTVNCHSIIDQKDLDWYEAWQEGGKGRNFLMGDLLMGKGKNCPLRFQ